MKVFRILLLVSIMIGLMYGCPSSNSNTADDSTSGDSGDTPESPSASRSPWLKTSGNKIVYSDGTVFRGRGANIFDTRSNTACAYESPDPDEVKRRINELVDVWGANFIRLCLESYDTQDGRTHWKGVLDDTDYLDDIIEIVNHIGTKTGVFVLVSLWVDPTFDANGWPTAGTIDEWKLLAEKFADYPYVMFGVANEPKSNLDGSLDADVWTSMNNAVAAIRTVEENKGTSKHIIAVQGTGGWARYLAYYINHPITAGGGENIVYETHVYNPEAEFDTLWGTASATLPVIIGEFAPATSYMSNDDVVALMNKAEKSDVSWIAFGFHMRCGTDESMLVDNSGSCPTACGIGMTLEPNTWGTIVKNRLATPWLTE